jgi:Ulp1 family protease
VPQQPNDADCALFTMHNLELLLGDLDLVEEVSALPNSDQPLPCTSDLVSDYCPN